MSTQRKPVVGYCNGRLVMLEQHEDCYELKARSTFDGRDFDHSAVVYQTGDGWFVMENTNLRDNLEAGIRTEVHAFTSFDKALRGGFSLVAHAQGWLR